MYACICICIYRDICKAIHMYVRMHACMHVCKHACVYLCMYVCMHVCICICSMHVHVQLFQITCIACLGDMLSLHPLAIGKCIVPHAQKQHLQQYGDYEFVWDAWAHCIQNSLRHWASFVNWMIWWRWELRSWHLGLSFLLSILGWESRQNFLFFVFVRDACKIHRAFVIKLGHKIDGKKIREPVVGIWSR